MRAESKAAPTAIAFILKIRQLWKQQLRFRIAAPGTLQRAAFQEYRRTDAGTVMQSEPFDVKDETFDIGHVKNL